jgi:transposase
MKKTRDGRRRFSREFKIAAVRRVMEGEQIGAVARDLDIGFRVLWSWKKRVAEKGEEYLHGIGRPKGWQRSGERPDDAGHQRRMAELERLVGRQQMEIRFLGKALRQVEERRQQKKSAGGVASSKR